jgi:ATP-dependent RNA helicase MSS116
LIDTAITTRTNEQLRPGYAFCDTVGEEVQEQTHLRVHQEILTCTLQQQLPLAVSLLLRKQAERPNDHKIIVFFTTAKVTAYFAEFWTAMGLPCVEIHSRKSQPQRDRASAEFRAARHAILFTSDVTARGLDYPDVTFVVQVGGWVCVRINYHQQNGHTRLSFEILL